VLRSIAASFFSARFVASLASPARADGWSATWLPGADRTIPRTTSASRDTPVLEYAAGSLGIASLGAEPGLVAVTRRADAKIDAPIDHAFHVGFYAMAALESRDGESLPRDYWRGMVGLTFGYAPTWLVRRLFGPGGDLELGLILGHESDHRTDAAPTLDIFEQTSIFQNFVAFDVAVKIPLGASFTFSDACARTVTPVASSCRIPRSTSSSASCVGRCRSRSSPRPAT
jgi:hypothetical protein